MENILIIGCGVVGGNILKELEKLAPDVVDKYKPLKNIKKYSHYDMAFVCVDTPYSKECPCDMTEVENAINENEADVYVIKSTILPTYTEKLIKKTGKNIIFSPEYYGGTQHCNNFEFSYTILGGEKELCKKVQRMYQRVFDGRHVFRITDSRTAEIVKYMENAWLATKVSFCSQFYQIALKEGVDYEDIREMFILDPRVNPSHTFVYDESPYWNSHCLNKDVPAIADYEDAVFLKRVIEFNDYCKEITG